MTHRARRIKTPGAPRGDLGATLGRGAAALYRVLARMSPAALRRLARSQGEEEILVAAAMSPALLHKLGRTSPMVGARLRGVDAKRRLLEAEGGVLSPEDAGRLLGVTRQAIDKQRRAGRLLAVSAGRRWRYPAWQLADGHVLDGMPDALVALRTAAPWVKAAFFLSRNARLGGRRPLDALRRGRVGDVVRAARAYGRHGAA